MKKYSFEDLSPEELVDGYVFPNELTAEEEAQSNAELRALRLQRLANMTDQEKLKWNLYALSNRMEDSIKAVKRAEKHRFAFHLNDYLIIVGKTEKELAADLDLPPAQVRSLLSGKADPDLRVLYRLEKHSGGCIPALLWWRVLARQMEHSIQHDVRTREREVANVRLPLVETQTLEMEIA